MFLSKLRFHVPYGLKDENKKKKAHGLKDVDTSLKV